MGKTEKVKFLQIQALLAIENNEYFENGAQEAGIICGFASPSPNQPDLANSD